MRTQGLGIPVVIAAAVVKSGFWSTIGSWSGKFLATNFNSVAAWLASLGAKQPTVSPEQFVTWHVQLFGRAPDVDTIKVWVDNSKWIGSDATYQNLVTNAAAENSKKITQGILFGNDVAAATAFSMKMYVAMLGWVLKSDNGGVIYWRDRIMAAPTGVVVGEFLGAITAGVAEGNKRINTAELSQYKTNIQSAINKINATTLTQAATFATSAVDSQPVAYIQRGQPDTAAGSAVSVSGRTVSGGAGFDLGSLQPFLPYAIGAVVLTVLYMGYNMGNQRRY